MATATLIEEYDGLSWYVIDGMDLGTGIVFDMEEFAVTKSGYVLDNNGYPLVESDWVSIAVHNSIARTPQEFASIEEI